MNPAMDGTIMRGLYWRSLLLLLWMMAIILAVGVLPHHA
jgi:hypothetical protein